MSISVPLIPPLPGGDDDNDNDSPPVAFSVPLSDPSNKALQRGSTSLLQKTLFEANQVLAHSSQSFAADLLQVLRHVWRVLNSYGSGRRRVLPPHPADHASENEMVYVQTLSDELVDALYRVLRPNPNDKLLVRLRMSVLESAKKSGASEEQHEPRVYSRARIRVRILYLASRILQMACGGVLPAPLVVPPAEPGAEPAALLAYSPHVPDPLCVAREQGMFLLMSMADAEVLRAYLPYLSSWLQGALPSANPLVALSAFGHLSEYHPQLLVHAPSPELVAAWEQTIMAAMSTPEDRWQPVEAEDETPTVTAVRKVRSMFTILAESLQRKQGFWTGWGGGGGGGGSGGSEVEAEVVEDDDVSSRIDAGLAESRSLLERKKKREKLKREKEEKKKVRKGKKKQKKKQQQQQQAADARLITVMSPAPESLPEGVRAGGLALPMVRRLLHHQHLLHELEALEKVQEPSKAERRRMKRLRRKVEAGKEQGRFFRWEPSSQFFHLVLRNCSQALDEVTEAFARLMQRDRGSSPDEFLADETPRSRTKHSRAARERQWRQASMHGALTLFDHPSLITSIVPDVAVQQGEERRREQLGELGSGEGVAASARAIAYARASALATTSTQAAFGTITASTSPLSMSLSGPGASSPETERDYANAAVSDVVAVFGFLVRLQPERMTPLVVRQLDAFVGAGAGAGLRTRLSSCAFLDVVEFVLVHEVTLATPTRTLCELLFREYLSQEYNNSVFAFRVVKMLVRYRDHAVVGRLLGKYLPLVLKVLACFPSTFAREFDRLLAVFVTPERVADMLHAVLELPLVCATVGFHLELINPVHAKVQRTFRRLLAKNARLLEVYQYVLSNRAGVGTRPRKEDMALHETWTAAAGAKSGRVERAAEVVGLLLCGVFERVLASGDERVAEAVLGVVNERFSEGMVEVGYVVRLVEAFPELGVRVGLRVLEGAERVDGVEELLVVYVWAVGEAGEGVAVLERLLERLLGGERRGSGEQVMFGVRPPACLDGVLGRGCEGAVGGVGVAERLVLVAVSALRKAGARRTEETFRVKSLFVWLDGLGLSPAVQRRVREARRLLERASVARAVGRGGE